MGIKEQILYILQHIQTALKKHVNGPVDHPPGWKDYIINMNWFSKNTYTSKIKENKRHQMNRAMHQLTDKRLLRKKKTIWYDQL